MASNGVDSCIGLCGISMGVYCERLSHVDDLSGARPGGVSTRRRSPPRTSNTNYVACRDAARTARRIYLPRGIGAAVQVFHGSQARGRLRVELGAQRQPNPCELCVRSPRRTSVSSISGLLSDTISHGACSIILTMQASRLEMVKQALRPRHILDGISPSSSSPKEKSPSQFNSSMRRVSPSSGRGQF